MFDVGLLQKVLFDCAFAGRIEDVLLDLGVNREFETNLLGEPLLHAVPVCRFELGEQAFNRTVVSLEEGDRVELRGIGHLGSPV